jgi:uncharacterized membrane protein
MIILLGLIILIAALVVGVAGVLGNGGSAHAVSHFSVLGYHLTGSAGTLFLSGIVVGAVGLLGLSVLLAGARRSSRRRTAGRRALRQSRRETAAASQERDDLIDQRDNPRADTAGQLSNGTAPRASQVRPARDRWGGLRALRHRLAPVQTGTPTDSPAVADATANSTPADLQDGTSDPDATAISPVADAYATAPGAAEEPAGSPVLPASAPS